MSEQATQAETMRKAQENAQANQKELLARAIQAKAERVDLQIALGELRSENQSHMVEQMRIGTIAVFSGILIGIILGRSV